MPETIPSSRTDQALATSTAGQLVVSAGAGQIPVATNTLTSGKTIAPASTTDVPLVLTPPVGGTATAVQVLNPPNPGAQTLQFWYHGATARGLSYSPFVYWDESGQQITTASVVITGTNTGDGDTFRGTPPTHMPAMFGIYGDITGASIFNRLAPVDPSGFFDVCMDQFGNAGMWRDATATGGRINFGLVQQNAGETGWVSADGTNPLKPLADTNLYRAAANSLRTDYHFTVAGDLHVGTGANAGAILQFDGSNYGNFQVGDGSKAYVQMSVTDGTTVKNTQSTIFLLGPSLRFQNAAQTKDYFLCDGTTDYVTLPTFVGVTYAPGTVGAYFEVTPATVRPAAAFYSNAGAVLFTVGTTGVAVGGGTTVKKILSATATLDFGSISAGATAELTLTVTGATTGSSVSLGAPSTLETGLIFSGFVSAADTVKVRVTNTTGSPVDPASATWRATVSNF